MRTKTCGPMVLFVVCATMCSVVAEAQTSTDRVEKSGAKFREKFDSADADHDGFLSRDEAAKGMPRVAKHFDVIDANHDGKISMQEIVSYLSSKRAAHGETQ